MSLNTETELPADVLDAIHGNRKIEAIKLLRDRRALGLKEAKDVVEGYIERHPELAARRRATAQSARAVMSVIGLLIVAGYVAYRLLS